MTVDALRGLLPDYGIEPVPRTGRRLRLLDHLVLWLSLGVGLLVLVSGSFLVPALGIWEALGAIALGSALGGLVLGVIAWLGARTHVPSMVLMRAPLGVRGSYLPTMLNVLQNIGWTVFEVIVIAHAARAAVGGSLALWTVLATLVVVGLVLGGPLVVVRRVLRAVGVPIVVCAGLYLTVWAARRTDWSAAAHGHGGLTFWLGVDLAVALPISWAPMVADYARFGRDPESALAGTALGSALANAWFYALGALLVLAGAANGSYGLDSAAGALVLGLFVLAEADKPFADLYSTVVSVQNVRPRWPAPALGAALGVVVLVAALTIPLGSYEQFLYLIGSFFVPLAGVLLGHVARRGVPAVEDLFRVDGPLGRLSAGGICAWLAGVAAYQWIAPTDVAGWPGRVADAGLAAPGWAQTVGASLPSFVLAGVLAFLLARPAAAPGRR